MSLRRAGHYRLLMCLLLPMLPRHARAQVLELSLNQALQQALAGSAEIGIAEAQTNAARGQVKQASLRPNPRITVQTEDIRPGTTKEPFSFVDSTEDYLLVGQTVETAGKRRKRVDVAEGNLGLNQLQAKLTRRQVLLRVSASYWSAVLADRIERSSQQTLATYEEDVRYIEARVKEGVSAESDAVRIRIERDRVRLTAMQARRDHEQSEIALWRVMGKNEFPAVRLTTQLEEASVPRAVTMDEVLAARPEVSLAQQAIATANSNLKLQRAVAKPDPQLFIGYKRNVGYDTAYAAVQVELPTSNRNQGNVGSAEAQLRREQENLRFVENSVRAEYESALRYYRDQQEMTKSLPEMLAQAQDSERRARAAYREGGLELLRLLDVERTRIQIELEYARALAELQQSLTTIQAASGADVTGGRQ